MKIYFAIFVLGIWAASKAMGESPVVNVSDRELLFSFMHEMREIVLKIENKIDDVENDLKSRLNVLEKESRLKSVTHKKSQTSSPTYQFSSFGCASDNIHLSCADNRTIFVVRAVYGKYDFPCTESCCPPHPSRDCDEDVEETRPSDWLALKVTCDNQTECSYTYLGSIVNSCEADYTADYMRVFYTCLPDTVDGPVGFTAYPSVDRVYNNNELALFDLVYSNFGGHYQQNNSIFICPVNGVYLFNVHIYPAADKTMSATLNINNVQHVYPHSGKVGVTSTSSAVLTCEAGSQVWVRIKGDNRELRGQYAHSVFSAYLLYQYI